MEPGDVFKHGPLYEYEQVLTITDLLKLKVGLEKYKYSNNNITIDDIVAVDTMMDLIDILIEWIGEGKPDRVILKGDLPNEEI